MVTLEHYVRLYEALNIEKLQKEHDVSLQRISEVLYCTTRNSKLTIQKWEKEEWVKWTPGRGRGNKSSLIFLKDPVELLFEKSKILVKKGRLVQAQQLVAEYSKAFPALKPNFDGWIDTLFGYKAETADSRNLDVLRMKYGKQPFSPLDPRLITLRSECHIVKHVCDTLISYNEESGMHEPRLAFHWEHNREGDEWTFFLRKGIRFHDGSIMTARDVKYSFERFRTYEENSYRWMLEDMKAAEIIDDHCIRLLLNKPNFLLLDILGDEHLSIIKADGADEIFKEKLTGTGPFRLTGNDGSMLVLEAHEQYFRERPFLDRVEFWNVEDNEQDRTPGKTEVAFGYSSDKKNEGGGRSRQERIEKNVQFLSLNSRKKGPMSDPFLRRAIRVIASPSKLVNELGEFRQEEAGSFLVDSKPAAVEGVIESLEKSSYKGEELHLYSFQDRDHVEDAEWLKQKCEEYGIFVRNHFVPAEILLQKETMEQADIIHDSATITEQRELSFLQLILAANSPIHCHLPHELMKSIKERIDLLKGIREKEERNRQLHIIEEKILKACQVLPLYKNLSQLESDEAIQQALINSQGWIDFYRIWFKRD